MLVALGRLAGTIGVTRVFLTRVGHLDDDGVLALLVVDVVPPAHREGVDGCS